MNGITASGIRQSLLLVLVSRIPHLLVLALLRHNTVSALILSPRNILRLTLVFGTPPTALFIDSGSANTWIGHNKSYTPTSTSHATTDKLSITYGDGTVNGPEYLDQITLSSSLVVKNQSIGVDDHTGDFATHGGITLDGILGIGPVEQTAGTLTTRPANHTVPTVTYVPSPNIYYQ